MRWCEDSRELSNIHLSVNSFNHQMADSTVLMITWAIIPIAVLSDAYQISRKESRIERHRRKPPTDKLDASGISSSISCEQRLLSLASSSYLIFAFVMKSGFNLPLQRRHSILEYIIPLFQQMQGPQAPCPQKTSNKVSFTAKMFFPTIEKNPKYPANRKHPN